MEKPDMYPETHWHEGMEMVRVRDFENAKDYIEHLEQTLAEATEDGPDDNFHYVWNSNGGASISKEWLTNQALIT